MIAIIDYGLGNLRSVQKAFEYLGFEARVTDDASIVLAAESVVLPGVGAFTDAMHRLQSSGMSNVIKEVIRRDKPFLGICLGMQLLFDRSCEGGGLVDGLKIMSGEIVKIPHLTGLKVPHMGWNEIKFTNDPIFSGLTNPTYVYFVHSFYLNDSGIGCAIATAGYGCNMNVGVKRGKTYGFQFHPEKSGDMGLKMLNNFGRMA